MTKDRWEQIKGRVEDNFAVEEKDEDHIEEMGGTDIEFIIFKGPLGKMKLEFTTRPVVLDKKTTYAKRIGADTTIDYVYSDTEKNYSLKAYKWDEVDEDWAEIDARNFT